MQLKLVDEFPFILVPHTEEAYQRMFSLLDALIDTVGEDETHPLASFMDSIGILIERYEDEHVSELLHR